MYFFLEVSLSLTVHRLQQSSILLVFKKIFNCIRCVGLSVWSRMQANIILQLFRTLRNVLISFCFV